MVPDGHSSHDAAQNPEQEQLGSPPPTGGSNSPSHTSPSHTPATHSCPSAQRLKQLPQWRSFLCRFTHLSLQRVRPVGQAHTLSSPRLTQFLEQHWESLRHLRPKPLQSSSSAKATPGKEANAPPTRAAPINLMALPRERVPLASPLASSSKEWLEVSWLTCTPFSPKDGTRGLAPPVDQCSLVCRATKAGATSENYIPRCEYPREWLWATPRCGLTLFHVGPKGALRVTRRPDTLVSA